MPIQRVKDYLAQLSFKLEVIEFQEDTHTSELAAKALGVEAAQIAKSLLFVGKEEGQAALVVTCGDMKVDQKKLKQELGYKTKFANPEQVMEITGFPPGGVCPFALRKPITIFLDTSMQRFPIVYAAAGTPHSAVPVTVEQLIQATGGSLRNLAC